MHLMRSRRMTMISALLSAALLFQILSAFVFLTPAASAPMENQWAEQPGGAGKWVVAGTFTAWDPSNTQGKMRHIVGGLYIYNTVLPAGTHEFKLTKNDTWNGFDNNGGNFSLTLTEETPIAIYVNEEINQARISAAGVTGLPQYTPALTDAKWPRLVGSIQTALGEAAEWSPGTSTLYFADYNFDGSVYKLQRTVPVGTYEAKVTFGSDWSENYGTTGMDGANLQVAGVEGGYTIFSINYTGDKLLTAETVLPTGGFDGRIKKQSLQFDSRSVTFKKPFGAVKKGMQDVTFRIAAAKDDVQLARLELNSGEGMASTFDMRKATALGDKDYFEVTVPKTVFAGIGVWGYKFILIDGGTKVEYGDDTNRGGSGTAVDEGAVPFDLTVYDPGFTTPDWMKNAVVYQILPDRFFDGSEANNRAKLKDGYRGFRSESDGIGTITPYPLQYFDGGVANDPAPGQVKGDWSSIPENPDRSLPENKPYYPDSETDGIWTNEFYGGDIQGVRQKLDYLKSIGVTAIYFNPIAWAASNHKYDATDYKHLDPMFGQPVYNTPGDPASGLDAEATRIASDQVFIEFANAAREKGIKLIMDGVFNHVGDDSVYFDRYEKYPEIGSYEYWAKVYDIQNATPGMTAEQAEERARDYFTGLINPQTGKNYVYPDDFKFVNWFTIKNELVKDRDGTSDIYKYDAWWGYDSLPAMDAVEPQAGDSKALAGVHEWNNVNYREEVIGYDLSGLSDGQAEEEMKNTASQRWNWMGASGWRLDVAPDVSSGTWKKFREAVKSQEGRANANGQPIEEPIILGEEWGVATRYLLGDQFDSVMNYRFRGALQSFMIGGNAANFNQALESIREDYPEEAWRVMLNLVGSHDTTRSITKLDFPNYEEERTKIAPEASDAALADQALVAIFQMGYPGAPTVYYGDEVGLAGTKDPDSRRTFPWERVAGGDGNYEGVGRYEKLFDTYKTAAAVRNGYDLFRTGEIKAVYAEGDVIAYARKSASKGGLVAINRSGAAQTIEAKTAGFLPDGLTLVDRLGGAITAVTAGGKATITLPAKTGVMMVSEEALSSLPSVTNLQAEAGNGKVDLAWNAVNGAAGYRVYRSLIDGGEAELMGTPEGLSFTDSNVTNATKYYYTVTAFAGTSESVPAETVSATPSFPISEVSAPSAAADVTLGVGSKTGEITVTVTAYGLTDSVYAGQSAPNLMGKLYYYSGSTPEESAASVDMKYKQDSGNAKIYKASFEPTEQGVYNYYAAFSTDNGETWTRSAANRVNVLPDTEDTTPPAAPELAAILQESSRAALAWSVTDDTIAGFEVYRSSSIDAAWRKIAVVKKDVMAFTDFTVNNDIQYKYKVAAYDQAYNRTMSGEQSVTPKLVMIDVTMRLQIPDYTPDTDDITIAGDFNGWNVQSTKLAVPSGATNRSVLEYSFKMMAGKSIQYKYARGSWATEAFASHSRVPNDTSDMGNWAYSSTDTNMQLKIANQGGNRMLVNDYVLRWADMPMIVSMPRISYGEDIEYTTADDRFRLKANVPYGVEFTINGQPIADNAMDEFGQVDIESIPLNPGPNAFELRIEPTQETLNLPWYTDKGRAGQATKTLKLKITRTSGAGNPPEPGPGPGAGNPPEPGPGAGAGAGNPPEPGAGPGAGNPPEPGLGSGNGAAPSAPTDRPAPSRTVNEAALEAAPKAGGAVTVEIADGAQQVLLPLRAAEIVNEGKLVLKQSKLDIEIPAEVLKALQSLAEGEAAGSMQISLEMKPADTAAAQAAIGQVAGTAGGVRALSQVYEFRLSVVGADASRKFLTAFEQPITLTFDVDGEADRDISGVYFIGDDGKLEYAGGDWNGSEVSAKVRHFSKYAVLRVDKTFADVGPSHWALRAVRALAAKQVVKGMENEQFIPSRSMARAEFTAMLVRALRLPTGEEAAVPFGDVPADTWYAGDVAAAYAAGIVNGKSSSAFEPNAAMTRSEMAVMLMRAYRHSTVADKAANRLSVAFRDTAGLRPWAAEAIADAAGLGLLKGRSDHTFEPAALVTRAEGAQAIYNLLSNL